MKTTEDTEGTSLSKPVRKDTDENTEDNIIETILKLMENAEQFIDKSGVEKKAIVLSNLKTLLGAETYEQYKYIIMVVIDFAVQVSKGRKVNLNDVKKRFFFCCK